MDWPPTDEMIARNEELLAERLGWPADAVDDKRVLERSHPGWHVFWSAGGSGAWRETGWYAWPAGGRFYPPRFFVYRATAAELGEVLALAPEPRPGWTPPGGWLPVD